MLALSNVGSRLASRVAQTAASKSRTSLSATFSKNRWNSYCTPRPSNGKDWVGTVKEDKSYGESPALAQALRANLEPAASGVKRGADAKNRAEEVKRAASGPAPTPKKADASATKGHSPWAV